MQLPNLKRDNAETAAILQVYWEGRARDLEACENKGIRLKSKCCGDAQIVPYRCSGRTCAHAARAAAAAIGARLTSRWKKFQRLIADQPWDGLGRKKGLHGRLVTLTRQVDRSVEKNWDLKILGPRVKVMNKAASSFWRKTPWGQQRAERGPDGKWRKRSRRDTAAIMVLEVGAGGMVHSHWLVYGEWWDQKQLEAAWSAHLGEPAIAYIQDVRGDIEDGIKEVVKYLSKGNAQEPLTPRRRAYLELVFRNVHRIRLAGVIRTVKVTEEDQAFEDLRSDDLHDFAQLACYACGLVAPGFLWDGIISREAVGRNGGFGHEQPGLVIDDFDFGDWRVVGVESG